MSEPAAGLPKYQRIASALRGSIRDGVLKPGSQLPPETAIARDHHASVPTVRQAMSLLRAEGLIESRHGVGTFVRTAELIELDARESSVLSKHLQGDSNCTLLDVETVAVPAQVRVALEIEEESTQCVRRRSVVWLGDEPFCFVTIYAAARTDGSPLVVEDDSPTWESMCTAATSRSVTDVWRARGASAKERDIFEAGSRPLSVFELVRTMRLEGPRDDVLMQAVWRSDRVKLVDRWEPSRAGGEEPGLVR